MSAYAIAVDGIGLGAMAVAVNGFAAPAYTEPAPDPIPEPIRNSTIPGGVSSYYHYGRQQYEIPVRLDDGEDEEELILSIILRVASDVFH